MSWNFKKKVSKEELRKLLWQKLEFFSFGEFFSVIAMVLCLQKQNQVAGL